jgi:hypothetical protein
MFYREDMYFCNWELRVLKRLMLGRKIQACETIPHEYEFRSTDALPRNSPCDPVN